MGWNRKVGRRHKGFKNGDQAGSRGGYLKKGGGTEIEISPKKQNCENHSQGFE